MQRKLYSTKFQVHHYYRKIICAKKKSICFMHAFRLVVCFFDLITIFKMRQQSMTYLLCICICFYKIFLVHSRLNFESSLEKKKNTFPFDFKNDSDFELRDFGRRFCFVLRSYVVQIR